MKKMHENHPELAASYDALLAEVKQRFAEVQEAKFLNATPSSLEAKSALRDKEIAAEHAVADWRVAASQLHAAWEASKS